MPIQIATQKAVLDWNVSKAALTQSGNGISVLELQTQKPQLEMQTTLPKIQIDQTQSFADAGLKNLRAFMDDAIAYGQQIVSQGTDRIVAQGNEMINIHENYDPIPDQAISNAYEMFDKEFNYGVIPESRPQISLKEGNVSTQLNRGTVANNTYPSKVQMTYTPWQVSYYMKQYNSIQMSYQASQFKFSV